MQKYGTVDDIVEMVRSAKEKAAAEKQMPPVPMPYTSPLILRMRLGAQRRNLTDELSKKPQEATTRTTYIGHESFYSNTPLLNLKPIVLSDMLIRVRYTGRVLICRSIGLASRVVCVTLGVEDQNSWAQIVSLYNFPGAHTAFGDELDTMFPENTFIAIREPMCKMALGASHPHIRIDSPSDIVFLKPRDPMLKDVQWATGSQQYFAAIVSYSNALLLDGENVAIRLNRSLARLRLGHYEASLRDLRVVLSASGLTNSDQVKALYRPAQAEYGLEHFEEAKALHERCLALNPVLEEAIGGVAKCTQRLCEQSLGVYDWASMFDSVARSSTLGACDVANYVGSVRVGPMVSRGGGRGMFATKNIEAGELLIVLKPIAAAVDPPKAIGTFLAFNFLTDVIETLSRYTVIQTLVSKLMTDEDLSRAFFQLYSRRSGVHDERVGTDSSEIDNPTASPFFFDLQHIESICSTNWFGFHTGTNTLKASFGPEKPSETSDAEKGTGLYLLASYINHSCVPNASRQFFNEVMVIRATQSIKAGEEITISYCGYAPYEKREKILKVWFDSCDCQLCTEDRLAGPDRLKLRSSLSQTISKANTSYSQARGALKQMEMTYMPQTGRFRPELAMAYHNFSHRLQEIAHDLRSNDAAIEAIEKEIQALEFLGVDVVDKGLAKAARPSKERKLPISTRFVPGGSSNPGMHCIMILGMLALLGRQERAAQWIRAAIWMSDKTIGGGIPMFRRAYVDVMHVLGPTFKEFVDEIEAEES